MSKSVKDDTAEVYTEHSRSAKEETRTGLPAETQVKEGYKKTKLGWIPEEWETPQISEVFEFLKTTLYSRNQLNYDEDNETYYIHYGDIHSTYKTPILNFEESQNIPRLNQDVVLPSTVQFLKNGDVIIADASEDYEGVGEAIELQNLDKKKVISGLHTFALRDKKTLTIEGFRAYIFKNPIVKKALKTIATGSKVYGISKSNTQKFNIVLPPLPEQRHIASILNTWDKAIAAQEQLIAQKQELKKGLMQQLLTGKKRFDGFTEEWEYEKIGSYIDQLNGFAFKSDNFNQQSEGVRLCRGINITRGRLRFDSKNEMYWNESNLVDLKKYLLEENDVVISMDGSLVGRNYSLVRKNDLPLLLVQRVARLRSNKKMSQLYLYHWISSSHFTNYVDKVKTSSGIPHISSKDINDFKIAIPRIAEQKKIASILSDYDKEIDNLVKRKTALVQQKQGLMQQLLTGKRRVKI